MTTEVLPCGTTAAYLRHKRRGEEACGPCTEANRAYMRGLSARFSPEQRQRNIEAGRRHYHKDIEASRAKNRAEWHRLSPEEKYARRRKRLLKTYGITPAEYDGLLAAQDNRCACCNSDYPGPKGWCIDHDHAKTQESVRGLLCTICNVVLAMMGDDLGGASRYEWAMGVRYLEQGVPLTLKRLRAMRENPAPIGAGDGAT